MYTGSLQEVCGIIQESSRKNKNYRYNEFDEGEYLNHLGGSAGMLAGMPAGIPGMMGGYAAGYLGAKGLRLLNKKLDKKLKEYK